MKTTIDGIEITYSDEKDLAAKVAAERAKNQEIYKSLVLNKTTDAPVIEEKVEVVPTPAPVIEPEVVVEPVVEPDPVAEVIETVEDVKVEDAPVTVEEVKATVENNNRPNHKRK